MARPNLWGNSVPRVELDQRARDARLRLVRIERLLVPCAARKGLRLVRLFAWRVYREPRSRTQGSMSGTRRGAMPEIDSAWLAGCRAFPTVTAFLG